MLSCYECCTQKCLRTSPSNTVFHSVICSVLVVKSTILYAIGLGLNLKRSFFFFYLLLGESVSTNTLCGFIQGSKEDLLS